LRRFELPNLEKWFHLYIIAQSSGSSIKTKNVAFYYRLLHDDFIVWKFSLMIDSMTVSYWVVLHF
jgi:hypothetical protein